VTQASSRSRRHSALLLALVLAALCAAAYAASSRQVGDARAQAAGAAPVIQPQLIPGREVVLLGSAPQGTSGDPAEAWAYRSVTPDLAPAAVDGQPLDPAARIHLLRYTSAEGWRAIQTPVNEQGGSFQGELADRNDGGRVTPQGGLLLMTNDDTRPEGQRRVAVVRDPGGPARALPAPGPEVVRPAQGALPAEFLSAGVMAARAEAGRTAALLAVEGRNLQTGLARWDGQAWSREPICVADINGVAPDACEPDETLTGSGSALTAVALASATGSSWLLARAAPNAGRGLVLFERAGEGPTLRWRLRSLGLPAFEQASSPGVSGVEPLDSPYAATATAGGVWLDGSFSHLGTPHDLTVFFDGSRATPWCSVADLCGGRRLDAVFSSSHRSFAWDGPGFGSRVIAPVKRLGQSRTGIGRGEYLRLDGESFAAHDSFVSFGQAAFGTPQEGWLAGSHITSAGWSPPFADWPVPVRRPLAAIASAPGRPQGALGSGALAVGMDGTVLRYTPGQGWDAEALLGSSGVARPMLRSVAWPSPDFAYAVGDDGAMWRWRRVTELWEQDPGAPFDFHGHLMGVAFQPGNPERGYAVGRSGVLLRYDKSWSQEPLPPEVASSGPLGGAADLMSVTFAGPQALVAAWDSVLVNDGGGWRVDQGAQALIDRVPGARIYAVAGLPDGGAVAAGQGVVLIRDHAGGPWRYSDQPLPNLIVTAVSAFREGDRVRALAAVTQLFGNNWPRPSEYELVPTDPAAPPPRPPAFSLPRETWVVRETATGWRDEQRALFAAPGPDGPRIPDPVLAFLVDGAGAGWTVGGYNGEFETPSGPQVEPSAQNAAVSRYGPAGGEPAPAQREALPPLPGGPARIAVGGHATCGQPCSGLDPLQLMPERTLSHAVAQAARLSSAPRGPHALLFTGGRHERLGTGRDGDPQPFSEAARLAQLLGAADGGLPVFAAVSPGDSGGAATASFQSAFGGAPAPFGAGPPAAGTTPVELGTAPAPGLARTHYAVDLHTSGGPLRVIVIDNSRGSLGASDFGQNPAEAQEPWLRTVLDDARSRGLPAVAMGNLSLDPGDPNAATDADHVGELLRSGGASAYVFDSPERQRTVSIPRGAPGGVPAFGSGSLGYRSAIPDRGFGGAGLLMLEVDGARRDPSTNRAPVAARMIPVIEDLALEAVDGRVINRSQPALFRGLGRRPRAGNRLVSGGNARSDPYISLPAQSCALGGCAGRIEPEVRFHSSDPDIADFVRQDPQSDNPRKPFLDSRTDKPVADASSGLLCAFNSGTTTVRIESGGLAYQTAVTVRDGSVLRPCGTVPLRRDRFPAAAPPPRVNSPPPPPPNQPPANDPAPDIPPPPPPPPAEAPVPTPTPTPTPAAAPTPSPAPFVPPAAALVAPVPVLVPLPAPPAARPAPPMGAAPVSAPASVAQPAAKVQKEREEEEALEHQSAYSRVDHDDRQVVGGLLLGALLAAALAGASLRTSRRHRDRGQELALAVNRTNPRPRRRSW
jgi:hypothetical protein